jgi:hypothetical protein
MTKEDALQLIDSFSGAITSTLAPPSQAEQSVYHTLEQLERAPGPPGLVREKLTSIRGFVRAALGLPNESGFDRDQAIVFILGDLGSLRHIVESSPAKTPPLELHR